MIFPSLWQLFVLVPCIQEGFYAWKLRRVLFREYECYYMTCEYTQSVQVLIYMAGYDSAQ
jgi:hypothetical protein